MKFALVHGQRQEAQPGLSGSCPACEQPMIAKCGEIKIRHWAHKGRRRCDPWWENETEWHRAWKNRFPVEWQEVIHRASDGEKHIADVKTANEWVIEFQHSHIDPDERRARNDFYPKLVWVVDGTRRKTDRSQFEKALAGVVNIGPPTIPVLRLRSADGCRLLREWAGSHVPVFFDFAGLEKSEAHRLWCLLPGSTVGSAYIMPCSWESFVHVHQSEATEVGSQFEGLMSELGLLVSDHRKYVSSNFRSIRAPHSQRRVTRRRRL